MIRNCKICNNVYETNYPKRVLCGNLECRKTNMRNNTNKWNSKRELVKKITLPCIICNNKFEKASGLNKITCSKECRKIYQNRLCPSKLKNIKPRVMKLCKICNNGFETTEKYCKNTCSLKCKKINLKQINLEFCQKRDGIVNRTIQCKTCHKDFKSTMKKGQILTCSKECQKEYRIEWNREYYGIFNINKTCKICNNIFDTYRKRQIVCSKKCRWEWRKRELVRTLDVKLRKLIQLQERMNKTMTRLEKKEQIDKLKENVRVEYLKERRKYYENHKEQAKLYRQKNEERIKLRYREKQNDPNTRLKRKIHYNKPEVRKRQKRWVDLNRDKINLQSRIRRHNGDKKPYQSQLKSLRKIGSYFNMNHSEFKRALQFWSDESKIKYSNLCQYCLCIGRTTNAIHTHHIFQKAVHPLLSLNPNNGIPLCKEHHLEVHRLNPMVRR
jgi:hypothetical protein